MFSTKLTRAAQRAATTHPAPPPSSACICAHQTGAHQRRSSSKISFKPSYPPTAAAKSTTDGASSSAAATSPAASPTSARSSPVARTSRRRERAERAARSVQGHGRRKQLQQGLPSLPPMRLDQQELNVSAFWSMHRPLSIGTAFLHKSTPEQFDAVFHSSAPPDARHDVTSAERRPERVAYAIKAAMHALRASGRTVRFEVVKDAASSGEDGAMKHLDGAPAPVVKNLEELVAGFQPYLKPPPPEPFEGGKKGRDRQAKSQRKSRKEISSPSNIEWAELEAGGLVEVFATTDGQPFEGLHDVLTRLSSAAEVSESGKVAPHQDPEIPASIRQPFLERMRRRQQLYLRAQQARNADRMRQGSVVGYVRRAPSARRFKMLLISVKRQRKLKMKKHKYKKLMKRTRTLRRKLERG